MYDAIDIDMAESIPIPQVEDFVRGFLRGGDEDNSEEGTISTNFEQENEEIFKMLHQTETGEVTPHDLSEFLCELLKNQVKLLVQRAE